MKFFHNRLFRLIITLVSLLAIIGLSRSVYDLWRKRDIVGNRQKEFNRVEAENKRLKSELEAVQSPEFVEREAREKLGMAKEGEAVVIMPRINKADQSNQLTNEEKIIPIWKKWWGLFF